MYTIVRNYTAAPGLAGQLTSRRSDIEAEIGGVTGFLAYYLLKTSDGAVSITTCEDRRGCEESSTRAANWLKKNLPAMKLSPPRVLSGEVSFHFVKTPARV